MQVLVTGGAGFIGSHLVDALVERGHDVRILDALVPQVHGADASWPSWVPPGVDARRGDVRDPAMWEQALAGCEVVYHLAAEVGVGQSMYEITRYMDANTMGTAHLLEILGPRPASSPQAGRRVVDVDLRRGRLPHRGRPGRLSAAAHRPQPPGPRLGSVRAAYADLLTAAADRRGEAAAADVDLRGLEARPGGDVPVGGPRLRDPDGRVPLLQRLRTAPGPVQPLHRRGGDLQRPHPERQSAGHLRRRPAGSRLHQREGHRAGAVAAARDRRRRLRAGEPRHRPLHQRARGRHAHPAARRRRHGT